MDVRCLARAAGKGPVLASRRHRLRQLAAQRLRTATWPNDGLPCARWKGTYATVALADSSFDVIVHPVSNLFVPDVRPVWREAFRVLRSGGSLLAGFLNPVTYIFDLHKADDEGVLEVKYSIPFSDLTSTSDADRQQLIDEGSPMEFGHSLDHQIGGQIEAGFVIAGFYEDRRIRAGSPYCHLRGPR